MTLSFGNGSNLNFCLNVEERTNLKTLAHVEIKLHEGTKVIIKKKKTSFNSDY